MSFFAETPGTCPNFCLPPHASGKPSHGRLFPSRSPAPRHLSSDPSPSLSISFPPPAQPAQTLALKRRSARLSAADNSTCRPRIGGEKPAATYVDRGCLVAAAAAAQGWNGSASRTRSRSTWRGRRRPPPGASCPRRGSASLPGSCRRRLARRRCLMVVRARPFVNLRYSLHILITFVTVYDELPQCMLGFERCDFSVLFRAESYVKI